MADHLTQLQERLDQLNTQLYASLRYISTHHSASPLPTTTTPNPSQLLPYQSQPLANGQATSPAPLPATQSSNTQPTQTSSQPILGTTTAAPAASSPPNPTELGPSDAYPPDQQPEPPAVFAAAQRELAHDLILKTHQIEALVNGLPGVERGYEEQQTRIEELEGFLHQRLKEREGLEGERKGALGRVEGLICGVGR